MNEFTGNDNKRVIRILNPSNSTALEMKPDLLT